MAKVIGIDLGTTFSAAAVMEGGEPVIIANAKSDGDGQIGDGKIFVSSLEQVVRIRTGETGSVAI